MNIEFISTTPQTFPESVRWQYKINGQEIGVYSAKELRILKEAAESDLRKIEGWLDETVVQNTRDLIAAVTKALNEAA